jgi:hnRNP-L/PTB/hephaestus splicing factor
MNADKVSCDSIFKLFGAFGDVVRVKIFYNKHDSALVQFADTQQAQLAINHLNNCPMYGRSIKVRASTNSYVAPPPRANSNAANGENAEAEKDKDAQGQPLTMDYSHSHLHRFRIPNSRNFKHICGPSPVLHVSNVPHAVNEDELRRIVGEKRVLAVRKLPQPQDKQYSTYMALVKFTTIEDAVEALIDNHDKVVGTDGDRDVHLRVSFSPKSDV